MKLKLSLTLLFVVLIYVSKVGAIDGVADNDSSLIDAPESSSFAEFAAQDLGDTENTMSWPMIPGESLNDVARAFYPKSGVMRRLFVANTLRLNTQIEPKLKAATVFEEPTLLTIPTLKSLSKSRQAINAANRAKANREKLSMSYSINKPANNLSAMLLQEYELLLSKNAFLKAELERLHAKIAFLQTKLNDLKLVLDKTLSSSAQPKPAQKTAEPKANVNHTDSAKKVFKNLTVDSVKPVALTKRDAPATQTSSSLIIYLLAALLATALLSALAARAIKKHRQQMFMRFDRSVPPMDDTLSDYGGQWQDTEQELGSGYTGEQSQAIANSFINSELRVEQAEAVSSLEEAKLLMSINRTQDAIAHLKSIIEAQPKTAINHWLYLLEIFRKLNLKADFENYAKSLHLTFNVMTPVWYEGNATNADANIQAKIIVPQHLEEFPHIMEKLDAVWPSELARVYLESLITDNRDGERTGFSQAVLDEILLLIGLLDARKALENADT